MPPNPAHARLSAPDLGDALRAGGASSREVAGHTPLLLSDPATCLLVEDGEVDIFLVELTSSGEPEGLRRHLFTLRRGDMAFPFDGESALPPFGMLAVGTVGTRLLVAGLGTVKSLAGHPDLAPALARTIDTWVEGVSRAMAQLIVPAPHVGLRLHAGQTARIDAQTRFGAAEGVVWIACGPCEPLYLDSETISVAEGARLPLHESCWLSLPAGLELQGIGTREALSAGACWPGLAALHAAACDILPLNLRLLRVDDLNRLRRRDAANSAAEQGALNRLAAPLASATAPQGSTASASALVQACAAVAGALGHPFSVRGADGEAAGETRLTIDQLAAGNRLRLRRVILEGTWWTDDVPPFVLLPRDGTPARAVIPQASTGGRYLLVEPSSPPRRIDAAEAARLSGEAFSFYAPFPDRPLKGLDVGGGAFRWSRVDALMVLVLGILGGVLGLGVPIATGFLVDTVIPGHDTGKLIEIGLVLAAAATVMLLLRYAIQIASLRIEGRSGTRIQAAVLDRLFRLPMSFFKDHTAGDLAQRAMAIQAIEQAVSGTIIASLTNALFALISLGLMYWYSPKLALMATLLILLLAAATLVLGQLRLRRERAVLKDTGAAASFLLQLLTGISRLRLTAAENRAFMRWTEPYGDFLAQRFAADQIGNINTMIGQAFMLLATAAIFAVIYFFDLVQGGLALGVVLSFLSAFGQALSGMVGLAGAAIQIIALKPVYAYAAPILQSPPETDDHKLDPGHLTGRIELNHLHFRYDAQGAPILNDLSLTIGAGEFVALVGPSGSGKSTLLRLLMGFETQDAGAILLDGLDLRSLDVQAVRRQFGIVLQNGKLMPGTLLDNILGANLHLGEEAAWAAARHVGLGDDIAAMPMGMRTVLTESSGSISGGQAQRLLLARAIVNKPAILILDEATSALDNRTQALVTESMNALRATRLVVAHRLSTVMDADRIVVLKDGRIAEQGSYAALLAQGGLFTRLAERQLV